ncbi:MAG TPA: multidrug ABC transporter ATP-binding protein [Rhodobacteraceae bacterium]|nr:multidrug ABC transporter ATP-binding protein [Paracoccaceae bacterium]
MSNIVTIYSLSKTYSDGFQALKPINLQIKKGEIFALLGPNGAGKTTLISIICGLVSPSGGQVTVNGFDIIKDFRKTRAMIGLVPQELVGEAFETVLAAVSFTRGLFGKAKDPAYIEKILRLLSLWDKKDARIQNLSGGMKRRVLIAKALSHQPKILFLDEPTAGVDVALRKDLWQMVRDLRDSGVTIILTTHYIEEAEEMADRVGVITNGELLLVEDKAILMQKMGKKRLTLQLVSPIKTIPQELANYGLELSKCGNELLYTYETQARSTGITSLLNDIRQAGLKVGDLFTQQSSLEEIFVDLVKDAQ